KPMLSLWFSLLLLSTPLWSQSFLVSNGSNELFEVDENLNVTSLAQFEFTYGIFFDLAVSPAGTLYAITDAEFLVSLDIATESVQVVGQLPYGVGIYTALVGQSDGTLLAIDNANGSLVQIDASNGAILEVTEFGQFSPGDLTFYRGNLIFPGSNLNFYTYEEGLDPFPIACTEAQIFGLANFMEECSADLIYAFDGDANVYHYVPDNQSLELLGNIFTSTQNIFGATTFNEWEAGLCPMESLVEIDCDALSTDEPKRLDWFISPNPTPGLINLSIHELNIPERIELLNVASHALLRFPYQDQIDLTDLSAGLYFLSIYDTTGALLGTQKLVKQE
ncbi:MAG: hypothetical protein AAFU60_11205, partial [Bacteroidota bacterium]